MALPHVNAVVIGAGAGGGVVAKELSEAGFSVVLFERGGWVSFEEHGQDELLNQRTTVLGNAYGPDDRHPRVHESSPGQWSTVQPNEWGYGNNAACVGSGTVSYGAMAWRFLEKDFRMRSTYGAPAGSTLEDWPIAYEDLEPFYEKAEWEVGVSGDMSGNPFIAPRRRPYPMPAFPHYREGRLLEAAARRLGFHPFPIPMLRNSVPYGGRGACIHNRLCCGYACPINAKNGTQNTVIPRALATGHCELRTQAIVAEIVVDDHGRARGVRYFDADDRAQYQTADLVVLSGGANESARLLLNSKSRLFPNGIGNRHDWVGRNLQDHAYSGAWGLFEDEIYDDVGPGATIAISDFNHGNPGVRGGAVLCNEFIRPPYGFTGIRPPGAARWGKAHKEFQRHFYKRSVGVQGPVQEMPMFTARVQVDPVVKDHWGIPVVRLSGNRHPDDVVHGRFLASKAEQWLKEAGAVQTWISLPGLIQRSGQHQAGTCRMGNDPTTSVTDRYGRVHEIDNVYVADGGLHVTNGGFNPVLTIMALGYWVSHHIKSDWKGKLT
ncbi:MAG TPA: GMC family oxidoreductase [Lacunisphaera sp.]|jgi:choline dehydrogenase-like flavoprotein|nr:GMC family oxidoreductase [Lacunisphaera sp.]